MAPTLNPEEFIAPLNAAIQSAVEAAKKAVAIFNFAAR
jgi:hypothetical protein